MHIYFSGIGGTGIGPLALIALEAGHQVSGSDKQSSNYITYLKKRGITDIQIGQGYDDIAKVNANQPIDWLVYSSALTRENKQPAELEFCRDNLIKTSQRSELINQILADKDLKMLAIAGTHGKSTTTAMAVWLFKQLALPVSYSFGAKTSFSDMGAYVAGSEYFVYEADEFARNFLDFKPALSVIVGVDYDHPDIYPTRGDYEQAFNQFIDQSNQTILWQNDYDKLKPSQSNDIDVLYDDNELISKFSLTGEVNRRNAAQVAYAVHKLTDQPVEELIDHLNKFPGLSRRFEQLKPNLYSDYAHTPPKIRGALQTAKEVAGQNVVVIYEGLHNTRQHFIKTELVNLFDDVKQLYIVPSYLAREDPKLKTLSPVDLRNLLSNGIQQKTIASQLDVTLKAAITSHLKAGDLVLCLTAGGGGSLDEWLRREFVVRN